MTGCSYDYYDDLSERKKKKNAKLYSFNALELFVSYAVEGVRVGGIASSFVFGRESDFMYQQRTLMNEDKKN